MINENIIPFKHLGEWQLGNLGQLFCLIVHFVGI